jgi:hypothetical protein
VTDFDLFDDLDAVAQNKQATVLVIDKALQDRISLELHDKILRYEERVTKTVWVLGVFIGHCSKIIRNNGCCAYWNFEPSSICVVPQCDRLVVDYEIGSITAYKNNAVIFSRLLLMFNPFFDGASVEVK